MSRKIQMYGNIVQIEYFMVFTASGFQAVMLWPNLMTGMQREAIKT